jgi:hypothetical protein
VSTTTLWIGAGDKVAKTTESEKCRVESCLSKRVCRYCRVRCAAKITRNGYRKSSVFMNERRKEEWGTEALISTSVAVRSDPSG